MKLTIEPSQQHHHLPVNEQPCRITIEVATDDLNLDDIIDSLIVPALKGMQYHDDSISDRIK
jgi:hypothetical protein